MPSSSVLSSGELFPDDAEEDEVEPADDDDVADGAEDDDSLA